MAEIIKIKTTQMQTQKSMIPFFYQDWSVFRRKIVEVIVKPKVLSDCYTAINLARIILNESSNLIMTKI